MFIAFLKWKDYAKSLNPKHASSVSVITSALTKLLFRRYRQGLSALERNNDLYKNKMLRVLNKVLPYTFKPERHFMTRWLKRTQELKDREHANKDRMILMGQRIQKLYNKQKQDSVNRLLDYNKNKNKLRNFVRTYDSLRLKAIKNAWNEINNITYLLYIKKKERF